MRSSSSAAQTSKIKERQPRLPLNLSAYEWPQLRLETEARCAAALLTERSNLKLRVLTWNVWFDVFFGALRQRALMKEVLSAAPDIVCLQEVLPVFAKVLRQDSAIGNIYDISPQDVAPYGCLMLVRKDLQPQFGSQPLPSNMCRSLLFAECAARCPGLFVATTHLESLNHPEVRRRQVQAAAALLKQHPMSILCGDFNFDDAQTWGDWRRQAPQFSPDDLENNVLLEMLPSFSDAWRFVHPSERGKTLDGEANPVCVHDPLEQMRYDRLLASTRLQPTAAELLGTTDIECEQVGLKPSDHFGLQVDLDSKPA